jgi:conjugation system TraG family ATPase
VNKVVFSSPFIWVDGNVAYANNGDVVKGYALNLPEIYSSSENDFDALHTLWYKAIKNLNPGTIFFKQDVFLKSEFDARVLPGTNYFQRATHKHFKGREYTSHQCFVFFIYTKTGILKNTAIKNPFKSLPKVKDIESDLKKMDELFNRETEDVVEFINNSKQISLEPLTPEEIREHARTYFSGFYRDRITDTVKHEDYYQIGDKLAGSFVIKSLKQIQSATLSNVVVDPNMGSTDFKFYRGYADGLGLDLPFDHVYNQVFYIQDHHAIKKELETAQSNLYGARGFGTDNKVGAEELKEYLEQEVAKDEQIKFIKTHFSVTFYSENAAEYKSHQAQIASEYKDMDIRPYYPIGNNLSNIINNTHPAHISNLDLDNLFTTDLQQALCLLSNVTNYKDDKEGIYFNDRLTNIPKKKDVWDRDKKRIKARNFFVLAPTGEGKSFLCNHIFRQLIEEGIILVLNDLGDSYIKLCHLFPEISLYIRYRHGQSLGINPLYLAPGDELTIEHINSILNFIGLLWKRDETLTTEQKVSLRKLIAAYYDAVSKNHSFPSFYQFIQYNKDTILEALEIDEFFFPIDEFLHNCSEFIGNGSYAFLFEETDQVSYDLTGKRIVVFEYDEAKEDPLLLSILLTMSSEVTRKLCWLDKSTRGIVFFDEFAKMLKYPNVLNSVQFYYQAARKQECAIGTVLQSPAQLPENDTAASIIDNTQVIYVLPNDKGYDPIIERFKMSSHARNQLMSMKSNFTGKRKYSEFYLQIGVQGNVMRLEVPKEVYCAYLTEGAEHEKIMKIYNETNSMEKAIQKYLAA